MVRCEYGFGCSRSLSRRSLEPSLRPRPGAPPSADPGRCLPDRDRGQLGDRDGVCRERHDRHALVDRRADVQRPEHGRLRAAGDGRDRGDGSDRRRRRRVDEHRLRRQRLGRSRGRERAPLRRREPLRLPRDPGDGSGREAPAVPGGRREDAHDLRRERRLEHALGDRRPPVQRGRRPPAAAGRGPRSRSAPGRSRSS